MTTRNSPSSGAPRRRAGWTLLGAALALCAGCHSAGLDLRASALPDRNPPCEDRVAARPRSIVLAGWSEDEWRDKYAWTEVLVLEDGSVGEVHPLRGNDQKLMDALVATLRRRPFVPGTCNGVAERQYVTVGVDFRPTDTESI